MSRNRTVLVMGASGRIGRALRRAWTVRPPAGIAPVWQYRAAVASDPGALSWHPLEQPPPTVAGLGVVVVLSGRSTGTEAELAENAALALAGLRLAVASGAGRVLLASSQAVYGPGPHPAREGDRPAPATAYGQAKLRMERVAQDWLTRHPGPVPRLTCLRIGNVAGADSLGRRLVAGRRITLDRFAGGQAARRAYIGPGTFAEVIAGLCRRDGPLPGVLNLAAPGLVSMADLARAWGVAPDWRPAPSDARPVAALDTACLSSLCPFLDRTAADPVRMARQAREMWPA